MAAFDPRRASRPAGRAGARARRIAGCCLLAGVAGLAAGCGGGGVAPVHPPSGSVVPGSEREHVVGKGDTVYMIAWRHGVDYRALARANGIREPYTIFPGQRLLVPEPGDAVPPASGPGTATGERDAPGEVSVLALGDRPAPALTPLPPPEPAAAPPPKPAAPPSPEPAAAPPLKVPKPAPEPAAGPSRETSPANVVAGVSWTWPTRGKTIGHFSRAGGKGIDVAGAFEQPVRAAAGGRVVYAGGGLIGYGKLVIVKHDGRHLSAYGHNERLHVQEGQVVKGGQHISDMGRSGKGRAMLHFEIRRDGKPVDPLRFLPRRDGGQGGA